MERLTERFSNGQAAVRGCGNNCKYDYKYCESHLEDCPTISEIYEKLAEYEGLEEQGKLIELPCAVGDTVYVKMQFGGYAEAEVRDFTYFTSCGFCIVVTSKSFNKQNIPFSEFGKTVFLTKPEAEAKLAEMEGKK